LNALPSAKPDGYVSEKLRGAVGGVVSSSAALQSCDRIG
jgi:hypothetical protein